MLIEPSEIILNNLYTNATGTNADAKITNVYGNGKMQAMVFPSVSYSGGESIEAVRNYIAEKVQIYAIDNNGNKSPVTWERSTNSNIFKHDIYNDLNTQQEPNNQVETDIRAPIFFVVPYGTGRNSKWVAELNGQWTSANDAEVVTVSAQTLSVSEENFAMECVVTKQSSTLMAIVYQNLPPTHKPYYMISSYGLYFSYGNLNLVACWNKHSGERAFGFMYPGPLENAEYYAQQGFLAAHNAIKYNYNAGSYPYVHDHGLSESDPNCLSTKTETVSTIESWHTDSYSNWQHLGPGQLSTDEVQSAINRGLPCVDFDYVLLESVAYAAYSDQFETQDHKLSDNYGNVIKFQMDWDYEGQWHSQWKIIDPKVISPY